mgnify:CR=1 FL=1
MVRHPERLRVSKLSTICKEIGQSGHLMVSACLADCVFIGAKQAALKLIVERYNGFDYF